MRGAERKLRKPLTPMMIPLRSRALWPNSELRILIIGAVITPQEKNCNSTVQEKEKVNTRFYKFSLEYPNYFKSSLQSIRVSHSDIMLPIL